MKRDGLRPRGHGATAGGAAACRASGLPGQGPPGQPPAGAGTAGQQLRSTAGDAAPRPKARSWAGQRSRTSCSRPSRLRARRPVRL